MLDDMIETIGPTRSRREDAVTKALREDLAAAQDGIAAKSPNEDLELDASLPGRQRLQHAAEQIRTTLGGHVHDASRRHGIPLPTDIPEGLIGT